MQAIVCGKTGKTLLMWNSVNVAIVLNNSHRFKDDPEYGEILKRMWDGTFTREDCNKINERLLGVKVLLPKIDSDADISYACWKNSERVSIHASTFQKHISNFPSVHCDENPPEHTVVLEADIRHAPKHKPRKSKNKNANRDFQNGGLPPVALKPPSYKKPQQSDMRKNPSEPNYLEKNKEAIKNKENLSHRYPDKKYENVHGKNIDQRIKRING